MTDPHYLRLPDDEVFIQAARKREQEAESRKSERTTSGIEHYRRAEELLVEAFARTSTRSYLHTEEERALLTQAAHVHALLANTAAVADTKRFQSAYYQSNGEEPPAKTARNNRTEANNAAALAFLENDK
ncbi:hypothetical protein ACIQ8G_25895 [Streptomyces sp. NPDC094154]|uniref:hypothetical protein n=1 Tax=Streptomyces sp. NPDC094154 TaxID=3366059 RepID=UPI0038028FDC